MSDHHRVQCSENCNNKHCDSTSQDDIRPQDSGRNIQEISDGVLQNIGDLREFYKQLQNFVDLTQELFRNCSDNNQSNSPSVDSIPQGRGNISPSCHHNCPHRTQNSAERGQPPQKYNDTEESHQKPCSEQYDSRSVTSKNKSVTCELNRSTENQTTRGDNCLIKGYSDKNSKYPERNDDCERHYESNGIQRKTQYHNALSQKENNNNKSCTCSQCQDSKNISNKINIFMEFSSDDECNDNSVSTNQSKNRCPMPCKNKQTFTQDTDMSTERNCMHNKAINDESCPSETYHKLRSERYNNSSANNCMSNMQQFPKSSNHTKCTHKSATDKSNNFQGRSSQYPEKNEDFESLDQSNSNRSNAQHYDALNQRENNRYKPCSCARCQNAKNINKNNILKEVSSDEEGDNDDLVDHMYEAIPFNLVNTSMPPNKTKTGCAMLDKNTQTSEHCSIMNTRNNCRFNKQTKEKTFPPCNHQKLCSHQNNNHRSSNSCMSNMTQLKPKNTEYIPCRSNPVREFQGNRDSMRENYNKGSQYPERMEECESSAHSINYHSNPKYRNTPKQRENNRSGTCCCTHCQHLTDVSRLNNISTEFNSDDEYENDNSMDYGCDAKHLDPVKNNKCPTSNRNTHNCTHNISVSRGHNCVTNKRVSSCTQDIDWEKVENFMINKEDQAELCNKSDYTKAAACDPFDQNTEVINSSERCYSQSQPQNLNNAANNSCSTKQSSKDCSCSKTKQIFILKKIKKIDDSPYNLDSSEQNANASSTRDESENDQNQKETLNAEPNQNQDYEEVDGETKYKRSFVVRHSLNSPHSETRKSETKQKSPRPSLLNRIRNSKGNTNPDTEDNK